LTRWQGIANRCPGILAKLENYVGSVKSFFENKKTMNCGGQYSFNEKNQKISLKMRVYLENRGAWDISMPETKSKNRFTPTSCPLFAH